MVNLIYNICAGNDSKQYKDSDNDIINYLELNKTRILDLAEKDYENFVEELTNDSIANASSNATLSSPRSSSTLPNLSNQNDR
jgi:site-specific recombinase XerD